MRIIFVIVLSALLSACGFQLRGANVLPANLNHLYVQAPGHLLDEVKINLAGSSTQVVKQRNSADVILTLSNDRYDRRVLSVDQATGKEREFELTYTLNYHAQDASGKTLVDSSNLSIKRDYVFDQDAIIGKSREQGVLQAEMRRDAIQQILYRLRTALSS